MASQGYTGCGDITDPVTGLPRVLSRKCGTCIYRPGNLMYLAAGRREAMQAAAVRAGSWIVCHQTLPATGATERGICRGFHDVAGRASWGIRLAHALARAAAVDWPVCSEIDPPEHPDDREVPRWG